MKLSLVQILLLTLLTVCYARHMHYLDDREYFDFLEYEKREENEVNAPLPSIDFTADWNETLHGELGVGRDFQINYADSRLAAPVFVEYKFNDGPDFESESLGEPDANGFFHKTISIPIDAEKVVIWFRHDNGDGSDYDSDYGKDYHFPIDQPSLVFLSDWEERPHGQLVQGGSFDLFYDSKRLAGSPVVAQMKFVGDNVVDKTLQKDGDTGYQSAVISIPDDAEKVVIWFYYEDSEGQKHYDSDYGQNYRFDLS